MNDREIGLIYDIVRQQLQQWRPEAWEDDLSKNTLDDGSFENGKAISEYPRRVVENHARIPPGLLDGRTISEMAERDTYPLPNDQDREGYLKGYDIAYWLDGLTDFLKVMRSCKGRQQEISSMLDLGCATGRVVRHFCCQTEMSEVWGSDINQRHVRWLGQFMPGNFKPVFTSCLPMLPIADSSLDLVCAFSVFTHIDTFETGWLAELSRVLRPGGLCYISVHNEDTWAALRELDASNRMLKSMICCDNFELQHLQGDMPGERLVYRYTSQGPYRSQVFHSSGYLKSVWGRFFDVQDILPRHHHRQTVVVMQKPQPASSQIRAAA